MRVMVRVALAVAGVGTLVRHGMLARSVGSLGGETVVVRTRVDAHGVRGPHGGEGREEGQERAPKGGMPESSGVDRHLCLDQ